MYFFVTDYIGKEIEYFLNCVIRDKEPLVSVKDARAAVEIALAAKNSAEEETPVSLPSTI